MATVTKTFTENETTLSSKSTWTISITTTETSIVAQDTTIEIPTPTVKAKYSGSGKGYALASLPFLLPGTTNPPVSFSYLKDSTSRGSGTTKWASGTEVTLPLNRARTIANTAQLFNTTNKDKKTINCKLVNSSAAITLTTENQDEENWNTYKNTDAVSWDDVYIITLDAPPTFAYTVNTLGTLYKNASTYSVTILDATAQYGGDIVSSVLTVGNQTATGIGDGTLSIILNTVGTFIPVVSVTDSRGQVTEYTLPEIIVNNYEVPSILNCRIARCDTNGKLQDDGENAILAVDYSYFNAVTNLKKPITKNGNTDISANTTWYTTYNSSTGVSNPITFPYSAPATGTIYGVIRSELDKDSSFPISLQLVDGLDSLSTANTQTLPPTFYTIDFLAGGKGVAFGAPSREEKFKVAMESIFTEKMIVDNDIEVSGNIYAQGMAGMIQMFAGATAPSGWLICDGSEVAVDDYPTLHSVIGDTYGTPSDSDHFLLPDLRDRFPVGAGDTYNEGDTGGYAEVALTDDEMPAHTHGEKALSGHLAITTVALSSTGSSGIVSNVSGGTGQYTGTSSQSRAYARFNINASHEHSIEGGDQPHENRPPYIGLNFIICTGKTS